MVCGQQEDLQSLHLFCWHLLHSHCGPLLLLSESPFRFINLSSQPWLAMKLPCIDKSPSLASLWMALAFRIINFQETRSIFALSSWIHSRRSVSRSLSVSFLPPPSNLFFFVPPCFWTTSAKASIFVRHMCTLLSSTSYLLAASLFEILSACLTTFFLNSMVIELLCSPLWEHSFSNDIFWRS